MPSPVVPVLGLVMLAAAATSCGEDEPGEDRRGAPEGTAEIPPGPASDERPNVVVLLTDDQGTESMRVLRRTKRLIGERGVTFSRAFASFPLCCPSRASFLTGQYAHNNGVQGNHPREDGGGYVNLGQPERTLASWMSDGGYETAHFGKWANSPGPDVPPGWDTWGMTFDRTTGYYDYRVRQPDGKPLAHGSRARDYHTDAVTREATRFIHRHAGGRGGDRPMFLSVGYLAPHDGFGRDDAAGRRCGAVSGEGEPMKGAAQPSPRHASAFADAPLPRSPSFNEADVSDKPGSIQSAAPLSAAQIANIETRYRCELASLLSVDEGVARIVGALRRAGELGDTYLIFTSDHGRFHGEHRRPGAKNLPYEEAIHVPLLIRGPGLPRGELVADPVANVDLAPTTLGLTGVAPRRGLRRVIDGRSLLPLIKGPMRWRDRAVLIEGRQATTRGPDGQREVASYQGVRTRRYAYSEHYVRAVSGRREGAGTRIGQGELSARELYDLKHDPHELRSLDHARRYGEIRVKLARALDRLRECAGDACQVEASPPAPLR